MTLNDSHSGKMQTLILGQGFQNEKKYQEEILK